MLEIQNAISFFVYVVVLIYIYFSRLKSTIHAKPLFFICEL